MTEPLDGLSDQEAEIEELKEVGRSRVLSFVAHYNVPQSPDNLGFDVGSFEFGSHGRLKAAVHDDLALPEAEDEHDDLEGAEVPMAIGEFEGGVDLDDQEVRFEVGVPIPDRIQVNDIELTAESQLRALRAACACYKIGQSGGKA